MQTHQKSKMLEEKKNEEKKQLEKGFEYWLLLIDAGKLTRTKCFIDWCARHQMLCLLLLLVGFLLVARIVWSFSFKCIVGNIV